MKPGDIPALVASPLELAKMAVSGVIVFMLLSVLLPTTLRKERGVRWLLMVEAWMLFTPLAAPGVVEALLDLLKLFLLLVLAETVFIFVRGFLGLPPGKGER